MTGRLRPTPRVLVAGILATLAAVTVGWLTLARGSVPTVAATTKIQHVVVIFGENESFDHYFGTYPTAANLGTPGEPSFTAAPGTPVPDGLTDALLNHNANAANPDRIARANALTCDQNHNYADEQNAFNDGLMNRFVESTAGGSCADHSIVMDYFDGNTVTALWNLAQHFTLSDNFFGTAFGPSTPGALNLVAGTTHGATPETPGSIENGTMIADPDPAFDDCAAGSARMAGQNVGDLLNAKGVTWGWFQGGFRPTSTSGGKAVCGSSHKNIGGGAVADYSPHHEPFMYYASTANPHHLPPTSTAMIGHGDQANHQYDLADFDNAVKADNLPQVSFLKAAQFEDAHPGYSDPLDEQRFVARVLDEVQQSPDWSSTAVVIAYDDSDGWYDHREVVSQGSNAPADKAICQHAPAGIPGAYQDRCGPGPRLPMLVVSPWTRVNTVDHTQLEQPSITRFIEDNWALGRVGDQSFDARAASMNGLFDFAGPGTAPKVWLDPASGTVLGAPPGGLVSSPNGADPPPSPPAPPMPTPPATPAPVATTPAPIAAPPVAVKKKTIKPKLSITAKRAGKKVTLTLKVTGLSTKNGKVTLSAKLVQKKKTVATSATGTVKSGKVKLTLKAKKTIKKGKYTISFKVKQGTAAATVSKTVTLK